MTNHNGERYICRRCLNSFRSDESLQKHREYCQNHDAVKVEMPSEANKYLSFKNYNRKMRVPFVIYADFECFTESLDTSLPNDQKSYTVKYQRHKPSGYCYYIKCFDDNICQPILRKYTATFANEDVEDKFIISLENDIRDIYNKYLKFPRKMIFTVKDKIEYSKATTCHICDGKINVKRIVCQGKAAHSSCGKKDSDVSKVNWKELFSEQICSICAKSFKDEKVRDHCHLTGKFRGAAHKSCNLKYKIPKFIPVIFHNLSGYDAHLFIKSLGKTKGEIDRIPVNEENYISFTKRIAVDEYKDKKGEQKTVTREIRFIDSFKFMASKLSDLVENLPKESFKNITTCYSNEQLLLLLRKGVFPYDWFDKFERLGANELPAKDTFYSRLNNEDISKDDYLHAQKVWSTFQMSTMREYHDLYLQSDVLLLADVFENFRDLCMKNYGLDPAWYYTSPGLSWDAGHKKTGVKLELLTDPDMLLFFEKGIRGGVSMIST